MQVVRRYKEESSRAQSADSVRAGSNEHCPDLAVVTRVENVSARQAANKVYKSLFFFIAGGFSVWPDRITFFLVLYMTLGPLLSLCQNIFLPCCLISGRPRSTLLRLEKKATVKIVLDSKRESPPRTTFGMAEL